MDNQQQNWTFYFSNITENKSVPTFDLEKELGPKRISFHILIPVTIVYCLIFITGIEGNIITCVVITKRNYMQTATNYYLFRLAISDLLSLILVAVVIAFFICWVPFHAQRLQFFYVSDWTPELKDINTHLYYVAGCFYYCNSAVNPILYNVMSRKYRSEFLETLGCHQRRSYNNRSRGSGYSTTLSSMNNRSGWKDMKSEKANSESSSKRGQHNGACLILKKSTDSDNNWKIASKPSSVRLTATSAMINGIEKVNCKSSQFKKSVPVFSTVPQSYLKNLKSAETFL